MSKDDTRVVNSFKRYVDTISKMVEWIIGLIIGQLALIISQNLFDLNFLFYSFLVLSLLSILVAILIMYVFATDADTDFFYALMPSDQNIRSEVMERKYLKTFGKVTERLSNFIIIQKAYKWLFVLFAINSVIMILLILSNINNLIEQ